MLSDIHIAQQAQLLPIAEIARKASIEEQYIEPYGKYKCKVDLSLLDSLQDREDGKLILVTAINPTPAGEGKTTTSVGLGEAMARIGKRAIVALREPSLGPVFGVKGGAAGGGYAQVVPMEEINLHFTGDMHAITAANNLLSAVIDNHLQQGNERRIDCRRILHKRCMDMNDRALRNVVVGLGGKANGVPREDGFQITVATEIMAILCLASGIADLKERLARMLIAYDLDGNPVYVRDLNCQGAMAALLKDALKPNLVQTLENTPVLMHGGPFANIAHGCNSVLATRMALKLGDYVVTEAGFGSDLGAEKFMDIKCRLAGIQPACIVIVATIRALVYNGGPSGCETGAQFHSLERGIANLGAHIDNMRKYGVPVVVAMNHFASDTQEEMDFVTSYCRAKGAECAFSDVFLHGGAGGEELARTVCAAIDRTEGKRQFHPLYDLQLPVKDKIELLAREIYHAGSVTYSAAAEKSIREVEALGGGTLPVCIAKTQYSLSDNPKLLGAPSGFSMTVRDVRLSAGAGFVVVYMGDIMTMPGLPKKPAALSIDIDEAGVIDGLF